MERELRAAQDRNRALQDALRARTTLSLNSQFLLDSLDVEDTVVLPRAEATYRPPGFVSRLLPKGLFRTLEQRLAELRAFNDTMTGVEVTRAEILLHADVERQVLSERWLEWADAYVQQRLSRTNPKDLGNPLLTYLRIYDELLPWLDELAYGDPENRRIDSVHRQILGSVVEYIPWRLYHATWSSWVSPTPGGNATFAPDILLSPQLVEVCRHHLDLYRFYSAAALDLVLDQTTPAPGVSDHDARVELQSLANDIEEVRPFLVRAMRPERFMIMLGEHLHAAPIWILLRGHLALVFAGSERQLLEGMQRQHYPYQLMIGFDGLLRHPLFHWRTAAQLPAPALGANLTVVRAIHTKLLAAFARIDVAAILREPRAANEQEIEPLAQANALLAEADGEDDTSDGRDPKLGSLRLSPRMSQLLTRLERDFDCRVRAGKGSEISIYRPGGRIFTLGRHKRNDRIRWPHVRQILRTLTIDEADWVASIWQRS
ncbi:hypothetical protein DB30_04566 [Enhygromyxa salina]|uniref:Uncharacterized protein n=2 Tax=Enhygromyxa salina TaxID=215803 RepID=A0A0C1ZFH1_9BACT|nr:hypothetical protein DB30_04566 [Enhygromyxa salina]